MPVVRDCGRGHRVFWPIEPTETAQIAEHTPKWDSTRAEYHESCTSHLHFWAILATLVITITQGQLHCILPRAIDVDTN
jgi:hypothetical protein